MDRRKALIFLLLLLPLPAAAQRLAFKTNLLYLAAATPNLEAELVLGERISVAASVWGSRNPYWRDKTVEVDTPTRFIGLQPEFRFWFNGRPLTRFYAGVNLLATAYDYPYRETLFQGNAWGAGLTAGYVFNLSRRLGLEVGGGAGLLFYRGKRNDEWSSGYKLSPNQLRVSLVYIFK